MRGRPLGEDAALIQAIQVVVMELEPVRQFVDIAEGKRGAGDGTGVAKSGGQPLDEGGFTPAQVARQFHRLPAR